MDRSCGAIEGVVQAIFDQKDRNRIERMFNRLKQFRCIATRYDKTRASYAAFLVLAAAKIWLPCAVNKVYQDEPS